LNLKAKILSNSFCRTFLTLPGLVDFHGLKFDKVNLPLLVQRVCEYYKQRMEKANIRLSLESQAQYPFVRTDRVAVAAVMDNLLSNAVKYSPAGAKIT
jgi:signal transduction histidine kinase